MKSKDNYPKAIAVYEAVLQLIRDERDLTSVTVAGIAKKAGIGKGTTYDYFTSKEEIIAKSLVYGYKKLVDVAVEHTKKCDTLKEKLEIIYEMTDHLGCVNSVMDSAIQMVRKPEEMKGHISDAFENEKIHMTYLEILIQNLIDAAGEEGLINEQKDKDYVKCVFMSTFQNIIGPMGRLMVKENTFSKETYLEFLYTMMVAALA